MSRKGAAASGEPRKGRGGEVPSASTKALNAPFADLRKQLRAQPRTQPRAKPSSEERPATAQTTPGKPSAPADAPPDREGPAAVCDAAELEAFRKAVGPVRPVRTGGRVEVQGARPAPVPRPRVVEEDAPTDRPAGARRQDPLQLAYEGVMPLRDSGRVVLDTPRRHHERDRPHAGPALRPDALVLPADADLHDPAALFRTVIGEAKPLDQANRVELAKPAPLPAPLKREEDERAALSETLAAPLTFEDRLDMGEEAAFLRTGLPRRVLTDLRRGRWVLQGQIDLHGLTRDEARSALAHFLHDMLSQGKRCIRVIHGKGHGSPGKVSILKQLSRGWLAQREEILAFCQAGPHDGGGGALLVLLRAQNAAPR